MYDANSDYKQVLQQHVQDQYATGLLTNSLLVSTDQSRHKISGFATIIIWITWRYVKGFVIIDKHTHNDCSFLPLYRAFQFVLLHIMTLNFPSQFSFDNFIVLLLPFTKVQV